MGMEKKMKAKYFTAVLVPLAILSATLQADTIPGRWELVDALKPGTPIIVHLKTGTRMECSLKTARQDVLELLDSTGRIFTVPKSAIQEVLGADKVSDSARNGLLWGALIGGGGGIAAGAATSKLMTNEGGSGASWTAQWGLVGAEIGALAGYLGDSAKRSRPVLYSARR